MPLRLKSLELHGYKTFATRTRFEFSTNITAIVGPNGSGKSNIADALRWVLGEQSYSLLRGKKTEDMIFSGTENRPRAGMASASIIFDNSDNWLPVDFSEVDLTRNAYRDGRNDYLLNSQHVRLREINELLAQSGLSERTYTILGQGLVDASLALKADERRKLFEEAAGIGLYRSRREEAFRRLDTTRRNLDRVMDILAEIGPRLKSLEKQAKRSQDYLHVQEDLHQSLREWYGYHWYQSQKEMNESRSLALMHDTKLQEIRETHQGIRQKYTDFRDKLQNLRSRLNSWHRESSKLHSNRESISREMAVLEERRRSLSENKLNSMNEISRIESEIAISSDRLQEAKNDLEILELEHTESESQLKAAQENLNIRLLERNQAEEILEKTNRNSLTAKNRKIQLITQQGELNKRVDHQKLKLISITETISTVQKELSIAEENYEISSINLDKAENSLKVIEKKIAEFNGDLQKLYSDKHMLDRELSDFNSEIIRLQAQNEVLHQAEKSLIGFADGARSIMESVSKSELKTNIQALSSLLDVPAEYEDAIGAALGEFVDSVILNSDSELEFSLNLLNDTKSGRATLIPVNRLISLEDVSYPRDSDCLGLASDLVNIIPEYRSVVDYLLGRVIVVTNRKAALKFIGSIQKDLRIVTLKGEVFYASGPVQGGKQSSTGILGRTREKRETQELLKKKEKLAGQVSNSIQKVSKRIDLIQEKLDEINGEYQRNLSLLEMNRNAEAKSKYDLETAKRNLELQSNQCSSITEEIEILTSTLESLNQEILKIEDEIKIYQESARDQSNLLAGINTSELSEQVTYWSTQLAVVSRAQGDAQNRNAERLQVLNNLAAQKELMIEKLKEYESSIIDLDNEKVELRERESEFNVQLERLRQLIEPAETDLESSEIKEFELQQEEINSVQILTSAEKYYNQVQLDFIRKQEAVANLRQKIEDDFGLVSLEYASNVEGPIPLPFEGLVEQMVAIDTLPSDLEETLSRQRMLLRRMGPINPEAQKEYESVSERHKFLETQLEDLRKAEIDLRQVISELDVITRQEFLKTFSEVADEFKLTFQRLFGGGSAKLMLTDPENLNETGIEIEARLPGKREQGLALLSGGERSLTAIALIFSLLKVSPTPVCVMDEVDAMLDEANVGRFRDLVRELSKDTQFIIITHNRNTVQAADVIYGVTMGRDSISQIISLRLDEVSDEMLRGQA